jgi:hypothetical protein
MPYALDPNKTVRFWLPVDADKPEETRPTFIGCHQSYRNRKRVLEIQRLAAATKVTLQEQEAFLAEGLRLTVVGWSNMRSPATGEIIPFGVDRFDDVTAGPQEQYDVLDAWLEATRVTGADQKNCSSQAVSDGESSAKPAPAEAA